MKAERPKHHQRSKIMTAEGIHDFNLHDEDAGIVKDFAYLCLVISSHRDCSQNVKRRLRLGRTVMEE